MCGRIGKEERKGREKIEMRGKRKKGLERRLDLIDGQWSSRKNNVRDRKRSLIFLQKKVEKKTQARQAGPSKKQNKEIEGGVSYRREPSKTGPKKWES